MTAEPSTPRLYTSELTGWYRLVDPPADHAEEVASYRDAFAALGVSGGALLDLGAGGGNNVAHLRDHYACTLVDLSPAMLALSRELDPDLEHVEGDMRTVRLNKTFDAVLVHDAVMYMTTESDLLAAIETAFVHARPGGAVVFAMDALKDTFEESSELLEHDEGERSMRGVAWTWDPDPNDTTYRVDYAFVLREGGEARVVHDVHIEGLFPKATWRALLTRAGFTDLRELPRALGEGEADTILACRRP